MKDLSVKNVDMVYNVPKGADVHALSDVSFDLEAGRLLTLLGPSGCGKTTLLNILAGFLAPTGGEVRLGGDMITGPGEERGMVFQQGALFEWLTVEQNISFGPRMKKADKQETKAKVNELLYTVGLAGFGDKQVYELSGGMQQRVALARCLANDPDVILMDEPLGALDALTREKMQGLILQLWKDTGKTVILVTHSVEEALYLGDRMFVMAPRPGRVEKDYELPFAAAGIEMEPRELKASAEFIEKREEVLSLIWEMEEEIMGTGGQR
jgi:taurine transport system ATP-binding protein